jgi:4-hydroxy-3-polyprenylbenzoate decarboxylase
MTGGEQHDRVRPKRIIVAITGATGALYGIRLLEKLRIVGAESHLVVSRWGKHTIEHETPFTLRQVKDLADYVYAPNNLGASISSGSFQTDGMVVAPCSARTLSAVATGYADDLIVRAADVTLKERRRLVLMVRETPLSEIHLTNMLAVTRAGGVIFPPMPAFYTKLDTLDALADFTVTRVLDLFDMASPDDEANRWSGLRSAAGTQVQSVDERMEGDNGNPG